MPRLVTAEQYSQGFVTQGGWKIPFKLIAKQPGNTYLVYDPKDEKEMYQVGN